MQCTLNGKPVYEFSEYANIDEWSSLQYCWHQGWVYNQSNKVFEFSKEDIVNKIKSVMAQPKSGDVLYFGKSSKVPRFKLGSSDFKRCIKLEKADKVVVSDDVIEGSVIAKYRSFDYFIEDEVAVYLINKSFNNIRCSKLNLRTEFNNDPIDYIKTHLLYGSTIIREGPPPSLCLFTDAEYESDILNIMNDIYTSITYDSELDKSVNNGLDQITEDDLRAITDLLDSPDKSSQGIGLKMLGALNINDIPLTVRTLLGFRPYLMNCQEWKGVSLQNTLNSINWKGFGTFYNTHDIIQPESKQVYTELDLSLCKSVYTKIIENKFNATIQEIQESGILKTFGLNIKYEIS